MILDHLNELEVSVPSSGNFFSLSATASAIDLNPNASAGYAGNASPVFADGEELYMQFEVTTSFASATSAVANFHVVQAENASMTTNPVIVATVSGGLQITNSEQFFGMLAASAFDGAVFHQRISSPNQATAPGALQSLRYMGIAISVPNYHQAGPPVFSAGTVKARIVKNPQHPDQGQQRIYPAGMSVTG